MAGKEEAAWVDKPLRDLAMKEVDEICQQLEGRTGLRDTFLNIQNTCFNIDGKNAVTGRG